MLKLYGKHIKSFINFFLVANDVFFCFYSLTTLNYITPYTRNTYQKQPIEICHSIFYFLNVGKHCSRYSFPHKKLQNVFIVYCIPWKQNRFSRKSLYLTNEAFCRKRKAGGWRIAMMRPWRSHSGELKLLWSFSRFGKGTRLLSWTIGRFFIF